MGKKSKNQKETINISRINLIIVIVLSLIGIGIPIGKYIRDIELIKLRLESLKEVDTKLIQTKYELVKEIEKNKRELYEIRLITKKKPDLLVTDDTKQEIKFFFTKISKTIRDGQLDALRGFFSRTYNIEKLNNTIQDWEKDAGKEVVFQVNHLAHIQGKKIYVEVNVFIEPISSKPSWFFTSILERGSLGKWKIIA